MCARVCVCVHNSAAAAANVLKKEEFMACQMRQRIFMKFAKCSLFVVVVIVAFFHAFSYRSSGPVSGARALGLYFPIYTLF